MTRYAVLLRGVNVGGNRRIAMSDFRAVLESLGHTDVSTYLQSGNAVVTSTRRSAAKVEREIEAALADQLDVHTDVLVRSGPQLAQVVAANPFPDATDAPKLLHVAFLAKMPTSAQQRALLEQDFAPERLAFGDRVTYVHYANGSQGSKLAAALVRMKGIATSRNWNTVLALADRTGQA